MDLKKRISLISWNKMYIIMIKKLKEIAILTKRMNCIQKMLTNFL